MPQCIVDTLDGRFAVWSTIVGNFTVVKMAAPEVIQQQIEKNRAGYPGGDEKLKADICQEMLNIAETGRAWPWAPTMQEAFDTIKELHGADAAEDAMVRICV